MSVWDTWVRNDRGRFHKHPLGGDISHIRWPLWCMSTSAYACHAFHYFICYPCGKCHSPWHAPPPTIVHGDGGSKVPWPLGPNLSSRVLPSPNLEVMEVVAPVAKTWAYKDTLPYTTEEGSHDKTTMKPRVKPPQWLITSKLQPLWKDPYLKEALHCCIPEFFSLRHFRALRFRSTIQQHNRCRSMGFLLISLKDAVPQCVTRKAHKRHWY